MTQQRLKPFAGEVIPIMGWFVTSSHPLVQQRFYAAIDGSGRLCWTDDTAFAEQFPMREDAERFGALLCADEDWSVSRR